MDKEFAMARAKTPIGDLWIVTRGEKLWGAEFGPRMNLLAARLQTRGCDVEPGVQRRTARAALRAAVGAVRSYFDGDLSALREVEIAWEGTELQQRVWRRVRRIRPGTVITYAALAEAVKKPGAFRAVGNANGANRTALFVPCHRVIGTGRQLQGYGAGLEAKAWLLTHEGISNDGRRCSAA